MGTRARVGVKIRGGRGEEGETTGDDYGGRVGGSGGVVTRRQRTLKSIVPSASSEPRISVGMIGSVEPIALR
jgi:hypothetical protein